MSNNTYNITSTDNTEEYCLSVVILMDFSVSMASFTHNIIGESLTDLFAAPMDELPYREHIVFPLRCTKTFDPHLTPPFPQKTLLQLPLWCCSPGSTAISGPGPPGPFSSK